MYAARSAESGGGRRRIAFRISLALGIASLPDARICIGAGRKSFIDEVNAPSGAATKVGHHGLARQKRTVSAKCTITGMTRGTARIVPNGCGEGVPTETNSFMPGCKHEIANDSALSGEWLGPR